MYMNITENGETMDTITEFNSLSQLILEGKPGDYFHDLPESGDRSIETYVLTRSFVAEGDSTMHDAGNTVGIFDKLTTRHHGKSELYGRPSYCYTSIIGTHQAETAEGSISVRHIFSMNPEEPDTLVDRVSAKRYGRKRMLDLYASVSAEYRFPALTAN